MKKYIGILLLFMAANASAQVAYWKKWNAQYPAYDILSMLKQEHAAAIKADKQAKPPYYFKKGKYRFKVNVLGATGGISNDVLNSINRVYKLTGGNPAQLAPLFKKAILVQLGNKQVWMPIQESVLNGLKDETEPGDEVTIYCLYLMEHTTRRVVYDNFLICEFKKQVKK